MSVPHLETNLQIRRGLLPGSGLNHHRLCACSALINLYLRLKPPLVLAHIYPYNYR